MNHKNHHRSSLATLLRKLPAVLPGVLMAMMLLWMAGCHSAPGKDEQMGTYYQNIAASPDRVAEAAKQVLGEMGYQAWTDQYSGGATRMEYRTSFDTRIILRIESAGQASSRVGVLVSPGNSEGLSQNVLTRIQERATGIR